MNPDPIRHAIQAALDSYGDGYSCAQFVVVMSLERIREGELETVPWVYVPDGQPQWMTEGLLFKAEELTHETADTDTD